MQSWQPPDDPLAAAQAPPAALQADLLTFQDELLTAATDLDRLRALLEDAAGQLMARFVDADAALASRIDEAAASGVASAMPARLRAVRDGIGAAAVALQFQDLAAQLLSHALDRIHGVADGLGNRALPDDEDAVSVQFVARACPVGQRQMDAGSIELY